MKWIDAEIKRPKDNQRIIVENALGLYWAIFTTEKDGMIYIEGKRTDWERWDNVTCWIPYPTN